MSRELLDSLLAGKLRDPDGGGMLVPPLRHIVLARGLGEAAASLVAPLSFGKSLTVVMDPDTQAVLGAKVVASLATAYDVEEIVLPRSEVLKIVAISERFGATAKISSIHVNGWFGGYDKLSTTRRFLADCFGFDIDRDRAQVVFAGDSPNDSPMFGFFPNSVGVANVLDFSDDLTASPSYVAKDRGADGFAELADMLIAARG